MRNKLFTSTIDKLLFNQYKFGSDLSKQKVVTKIFNPYGEGRWYLLNSDPDDPDYLWAIVSMHGNVEIGSVSRNELMNLRLTKYGLPLERDLYFTPKNAKEIYEGLLEGEHFAKGGVLGLSVSGYTIKGRKGNYYIHDVQGRLVEKTYETLDEVKKAFDRLVVMRAHQKHESKSMSETLADVDRFYAKGGMTSGSDDLYIGQLSSMSGTREIAVKQWISSNHLSNDDVLNIIQGLGRKQISTRDFVNAVLGDKKATMMVINYAKSGKGFMAQGGVYSSDKMYELKVYDGETEELLETKRFRARNMKEAEEIAEDNHGESMKRKYGNYLRFKVGLAGYMAQGGELTIDDYEEKTHLDAEDFARIEQKIEDKFRSKIAKSGLHEKFTKEWYNGGRERAIAKYGDDEQEAWSNAWDDYKDANLKMAKGGRVDSLKSKVKDYSKYAKGGEIYSSLNVMVGDEFATLLPDNPKGGELVYGLLVDEYENESKRNKPNGYRVVDLKDQKKYIVNPYRGDKFLALGNGEHKLVIEIPTNGRTLLKDLIYDDLYSKGNELMFDYGIRAKEELPPDFSTSGDKTYFVVTGRLSRLYDYATSQLPSVLNSRGSKLYSELTKYKYSIIWQTEEFKNFVQYRSSEPRTLPSTYVPLYVGDGVIDAKPTKTTKSRSSRYFADGGEMDSKKKVRFDEGGETSGQHYEPTYLMTLDEYINLGIPTTIKNYEKFIKKNGKYLARAGYSGLDYWTLEDALESSENPFEKGSTYNFVDVAKLGGNTRIDYARAKDFKNYLEETYTQDPTPIDIRVENQVFREKLSKYFPSKINKYKEKTWTTSGMQRIDNEFKKTNKVAIRNAMQDGVYKELLNTGKISIDRLKEITDSVGVRITKDTLSGDKKVEFMEGLKKTLSGMPQKSFDKVKEFAEDFHKELKELSDIVYEKEYKRLSDVILSFIGERVEMSRVSMAIPISLIYIYDYTSEQVEGKTKYYYDRITMVDIKALQPNWEKYLKDYVKFYVEALKWNIVRVMADVFRKVTIPIKSYEKISLDKGVNGFEGRYKFNFEDGSSFVVNTQGIGAGGYNIQVFHYRYLTNITNATLPSGEVTKDLSHWEKRYAMGGEIKKHYRHKHIPTMTLEVLDYTYSGIKGLQKDTKSLSPKERKEGKMVFYSKADLNDLFEELYAEGGDVDFMAGGGAIKQNEGKLFNEKGEMLVYKKQSKTSSIYDVDVYEPRKTDVGEYSKFKYCKREKNGRECVYRLDKNALLEMIKKEKFIYAKGGGIGDDEMPNEIVGNDNIKFIKVKNHKNPDGNIVYNYEGYWNGHLIDGFWVGGINELNRYVENRILSTSQYNRLKWLPIKELPKYAKGGVMGYERLVKKVAQNYEGKSVPKKYQSEYGKTYDKSEAKQVGYKVATKVYGMPLAKMKK